MHNSSFITLCFSQVKFVKININCIDTYLQYQHHNTAYANIVNSQD